MCLNFYTCFTLLTELFHVEPQLNNETDNEIDNNDKYLIIQQNYL